MNYEISNFELARLLLPWSICCVENSAKMSLCLNMFERNRSTCVQNVMPSLHYLFFFSFFFEVST